MIEVFASFECKTNTFFVAVDLMDAYTKETSISLSTKSIHLIGITAMLLATKMEEISPFKVKMVAEKIAHGKLTKSQIVDCETEFLRCLDFRLFKNPSLFIFVELVLVRLNFHFSDLWNELYRVVTYITKMAMFELDILGKYSIQYVACGCVYLCFKIMEQAKSDFHVKIYLEEMKNIFELNEVEFYNTAEELLKLAKNFETEFFYAKNLLKYDSFSLEKNV